MKLQAEVTGGGEGAKFALKCLTPVLVLMYLEKTGLCVESLLLSQCDQ